MKKLAVGWEGQGYSFRMMRAILVLCLFVVLPGCAPRGAISYLPLPLLGDERLQRVYVATNRNLREGAALEIVDQEFGGKRNPELAFGRVDVSIPFGHELGQIEWPLDEFHLDPTAVFLTRDGEIFGSEKLFMRALAQETSHRKKELLLFVHGYNTNNAEAVYRLAQLAHDYEVSVPVVAFSWPSAAKTGAYVYDRDSVIFSRDGFEYMLETLTGNGWTVTVIAHSMGTQLVMETFRQMSIAGKTNVLRKLGGVALISPDIDEDVFLQQSRRIAHFPQPFLLMVSTRDRALEVSAWLTGKPTRLGSIKSTDELKDLPIDVIDLSDFRGGDRGGHTTAFSAPAAIEMLRDLDERF